MHGTTIKIDNVLLIQRNLHVGSSLQGRSVVLIGLSFDNVQKGWQTSIHKRATYFVKHTPVGCDCAYMNCRAGDGGVGVGENWELD
jgi:hypothetical protein